MLLRRSPGALAIAAVIALAACAQHGVTPSLPSQAYGLPNTSTPPDCKGQKTLSDYATIAKNLKAGGGKFCIPAFGGWGGDLRYPSVKPSVKLTLSDSTDNWDNFANLLSSSNDPLFYMQFSISGGTQFGSKLKAGGGLTSATLVPGDTYTAIGQAKVFGFKVKLGPCYIVATKGKYGGVISGLGALVKGQDLPEAVTGIIEIYSGQLTSTDCSTLDASGKMIPARLSGS